MEDLVATVKDLQRSDPAAKEQWWAYCDSMGQGIHDPAKHNAVFIQTFINKYNAGHRFEQVASNVNLAQLFKEGQRKSANWKTSWAQYCQHYGGGVNDPEKHEVSFLVGFLDFLGQRGNMALSMMQAPIMGVPMVGAVPGVAPMGPPTKRQRVAAAAPAGTMTALYGTTSVAASPVTAMSTGDVVKDSLVARVKAFQRSSDDAKQHWWNFCDQQLGGVRDPARHDTTTLQQFIVTYGVP